MFFLPHNILCYLADYLLPTAQIAYVELRKIHSEMFYLHLNRSLGAPKLGAVSAGCLSWAPPRPGEKGSTGGQCKVPKLSFPAGCITCTQHSLLKKKSFQERGFKVN